MASLRFYRGYRFGTKLSVLFALLAAIFAGQSASADPLGAGTGTLYRLAETSSFQEGCFQPCMCPISDTSPARGTMLLAYEGNVNGIETYAVREVNFSISTAGVSTAITGQGVYRIGSPNPMTVIEHRLELDLVVGDDEVAHYDSGWVAKSTMDSIATTISVNGMYCWDRVLELDARPLPPTDIVHYALLGGSTFQQGCWDPCDCLLGSELPMTGSFDLVPLWSNGIVSEFAVLNIDWQVASPDVATTTQLRGFGIYRIRENVAIEHQMVLAITVDGAPLTRFDSGWVAGGGAFPNLGVVLTMNGLVCFDIELRVVAGPSDSLVCGGFAGLPCPDGQFCKMLPGRCCCDFTGLCTPVPTVCPAIWNPVCGCDGVTYSNECEADSLGVSIDHNGPCAVDCRPNDDGFGCVSVACSDVPEIQCLGTVLELDITTGAVYTAACECLDFNFCRIEFGNASPFAVGYCPDGSTCEVASTDTNGDGQPDRFTAECVQRDHACCLPDNTCLMLPFDICAGAGGQSIPGVGCDVVFCGPFPEGACCLPVVSTGDLACEVITEFDCAERGGNYLGDGSTCPFDPTVPCGPPDGACCLPTGQCLLLPIEVCIAEGGSPIPGVGCEVVDCAPPTDGACCVSTAAGSVGCVILSGDQCIAEGGEYLGNGSLCPPDPSLPCGAQPEGACCLGDPAAGTACLNLTLEACLAEGGNYLGDGTLCETSPNLPCASPEGACCLPDGSCLVLPIEVCLVEGGSPLPGVACDVVECVPPADGACCLANAAGTVNCLTLTRDQCAVEGGDYLGDGSLCPADPTLPCGPLPDGACCLANSPAGGGCVVVTRDVCANEGGTYLGDGTTCLATDPGGLPCDSTCPVPCPSGSACTTQCGLIVPGEGCLLFESDPGGLYILENTGGFTVGDYVSVTGCLVPDCVTTCMQGSECIVNNTIEVCGAVCGGITGIPCDDPAEFCKFPIGTCNWSDMQGICTPIPSGGCPESYQPVCGCDGVTYGNVCESDAAGVSILHEGECESRCAATRFLAQTDVAYCPATTMIVRILLEPPAGTSAIALDDTPPAGWVVSEISDGGSFDAANGKVKWGPFFAPFPTEVSYVVVPGDNEVGVRCFAGTVSVDGVNQAVCGDECADRACCTKMPADLPQPACDLCGTGDCGDCENATCGDGTIGLCELIGYACRWIRGCNDDLAGMTRAAFIWRNGECYCWNEPDQSWSVTDCSPNDAGCCTNSTVPGGMPAFMNDPGSATAKLQPGRKGRSVKMENITIPIVVNAPTTATAMALEFYVPKGWDVVAISDDGGFDEGNRKIKWGPVFDNLSRTLSVDLRWIGGRAKADSPRLSVRPSRRTFTGTVSFDGVNSRIRIE
jgi:Kazal-type serine protease inhibitor domain